MKRLLLLLPLICIFIPGCLLLSLHPYYEDEDIEEHKAFAGKWQSDKGKTIWEFIPKKTGYQVTIKEGEKLGKFKVTPFNIGDELFLDFYADMTVGDKTLSPFYSIHRIPTHSLMHIKTARDTPIFRITDIDWFIDYLRAKPEAIKHEWLDDGKFPVLTASPKELQAFILQHVKTEGAFEAIDLERMPAETE